MDFLRQDPWAVPRRQCLSRAAEPGCGNLAGMEEQRPQIGVLAMQGAFREHVRALGEAGASAFEVRTPAQLELADALVLPGGESTAIRKALVRAGLYEPLGLRLTQGMPAFGTCAGLVVLASAPPDGAPDCYGVLDVTVERNGFGRQRFSFEAPVRLAPPISPDDAAVPGVFIRAPRITGVNPDRGCGVAGWLARVEPRPGQPAAPAEPVVVRQGNLLGCSFHPELTADRTLHHHFVHVVSAHLAATQPTATVAALR
jgi:5'-phosphate synthase pdxT subunit